MNAPRLLLLRIKEKETPKVEGKRKRKKNSVEPILKS